MRRIWITAMATVAAGVMTSPASASLVYRSDVTLSAQGFGNANRDLTIQGSVQNGGAESGCVGVGGTGAITFGSCITNAQVHDSNGVQNTNGTGDLPSPLADDQKYGVPTIGSLGMASANDIAILFNAAEPGGDSITVTDLTLKFYSAAGDLLAAIDTDQSYLFNSTLPGTGSAGFTFLIDSAEQSYLNGLIFNRADVGSIRMALEASLTGSAGGSENFAIVNPRFPTPAVPEPATWAMMLVGFGGIGMALRRMRRGTGALMQLA